MTDYIVPLLLLFTAAIALGRKEDPYQLMDADPPETLALLRSI